MIQVRCFKDASATFFRGGSQPPPPPPPVHLAGSDRRPLDSGAGDFGDVSGSSANWKVSGSIPDGPRAPRFSANVATQRCIEQRQTQVSTAG